MSLPIKYEWLAKEGGPKMLQELLEMYGTKRSTRSS
jgi:hypothetical protein